jgi:hypothetical protein
LQKKSGAVVEVAIAAIRIAENMVDLLGETLNGWKWNQPRRIVRIGSLSVKAVRMNYRNKCPFLPNIRVHLVLFSLSLPPASFLLGLIHDYS